MQRKWGNPNPCQDVFGYQIHILLLYAHESTLWNPILKGHAPILYTAHPLSLKLNSMPSIENTSKTTRLRRDFMNRHNGSKCARFARSPNDNTVLTDTSKQQRILWCAVKRKMAAHQI